MCEPYVCPECHGSGDGDYSVGDRKIDCYLCEGFGDIDAHVYVAHLENKVHELTIEVDKGIRVQAELSKAWARIEWLNSRIRLIWSVIEKEL